ncbi:MAG: hypothetical protein IT428_15765 [Planctomycetaceae bacterium]|nr:hypothetical protein [Planctomycetaceae bacterium]
MNAIENLQERIAREPSPSGIHKLLEEIRTIEKIGLPVEGLDGCRLEAFSAARRATLDAPKYARPFVLEELLPLCMRADSEWAHPPRPNPYPTLLREWLAELPRSDHVAIRAEALAIVAKARGDSHVKSACRTIAAIGFRSALVDEWLWNVIYTQDDETGDLALAIRIGLGVDPTKCIRYVSQLFLRTRERWNHSLISAVQHLAGREVFKRIKTTWFRHERLKAERANNPMLVNATIPIIAAVADSDPSDTALQNVAWKELLWLHDQEEGVFHNQALISTNLLQRVDHADIVGFFLQALAQNEPHRHFLTYLRSEECVRPHQLSGWQIKPSEKVLRALYEDACSPTEMEGSFATVEFDSKRDAWSTLLSLGDPELLPPWDRAIEGERSGYSVAEILELAACFRNAVLPRVVPELLATRYGNLLTEGNQREIAHIASVHVAHSALSDDAFQALLAFQPFRENRVLVSIVDGLADSAAALFRRGKSHAIEELWRRILPGGSEHVRSACAGAIARLIRLGVIDSGAAHAAFEQVEDPQFDIYARLELLEAFGHLPRGSLSEDILVRTRGIAIERIQRGFEGTKPEDKHPLRDAALAVLARHGTLARDNELLERGLGFRRDDGEWKLASAVADRGMVPHVAGILLVDFPERFALVASQIVRDAGTRGLYHLAPFLRSIGDHLPTVILEAIVDRAHVMDRGRIAEPEVLMLLARISPERFLQEPWDSLDEWLPQARGALADALAAAGPLKDELADRRGHLFTRLIGDGLFGVRRSAYRAIADINPHLLANLCATWANAEGHDAAELKRRAAEGAAWLDEKYLVSAVRSLSWDPELTVREAWARSVDDRRERTWAGHCLERVVAIKKPEDVHTAWAFGRALEKLGDDRVVDLLEQRAKDVTLPPSVRHWLGRILKKVRRRWDDVTKKWPEPWFTRRAGLEAVSGVARGQEGSGHRFEGCLWVAPGESPTERASWGGWTPSKSLPLEELILEIPGRSSAKILVLRTSYGEGPTFFVGNGDYPEAK